MKVIICEYHPWNAVGRIGNHHYAREFLSSGWDVLWISHPVSFLHGLKAGNEERMRRSRKGPEKHANGPTELVPCTYLPFLNSPGLSSIWVLENSHRFFRPSMRRSLILTGFHKPDLVWITDTVMHPVADIAEAKAVAVRIADDNVAFRNMPSALKRIEDKLAKRADAIFVTSSPLEDRFRRQYAANLTLLRNGVDVAHFQGDFSRPDEYDDIKGPIAVYVGAIEEWFEPSWVQKLARERADITVVLIGQAGIDMGWTSQMGNVRALGPRPYEEIPRYLVHADCGIIPFKRTRLVESVSPLKLFEFFASGLPVVSTRWRELESLDSPALLASSDDEFVSMVSRAIDENWKKERRGQFLEYARRNSWHERFSTAMESVRRFVQ